MYREMFPCPICEKVLSTIFELQSHLNSHKQISHNTSSKEDNVPDDENRSTNEDDENRSTGRATKEDDEMSVEDDEEEEESKNWDTVMCLATHCMKDDLWDELYYTDEDGKEVVNKKNLFERLRIFVPTFLKLAKYIENSDIYERIEEEVDRLTANDEDYDDAVHRAWKSRKFQIYKKIIDPWIEKNDAETNAGDDENEDDDN